MSDSEEDDTVQLQFKVILLGDGTVGKTSIAMRFTQDYFNKVYKQTIGLDFFLKRIDLPRKTRVALQIWDIGGQSIGSKLLSKYIYGSDAILFCYDITNYESFRDLEDWYRLVSRTYDGRLLPSLNLVGTKADLEHLRTVDRGAHSHFARENDMSSFLVSAKANEQINQMFYRLAGVLAGMHLTEAEINQATSVVPAQIVDHPRNDPEVPEKEISQLQDRTCLVA